MSSASIKVIVTPKRMLTRREAAEHCGRSLKRFELECPALPIRFANGDLRWDVRDLDRWLDTMKTAAQDSNDDIVQRLGVP